jgi:hypothetical protein
VNPSPKQEGFPTGLLDWAGHRAGGVKRLFHGQSSRPSGDVIRTPLLAKLEDWAASVLQEGGESPRIVLLVGGPGNGKTEAVEQTIKALDGALGVGGAFVGQVSAQFLSVGNAPPPRIVTTDVSSLTSGRSKCQISIVQDASVADPKYPGKTPADLLVQDMGRICAAGSKEIYLACVNRGVLDDALIATAETDNRPLQTVFEAIVQSVGLTANSIACWPIPEYPHLAAWPMDIDTLFGDISLLESASPVSQILTIATDATKWRAACPAGDKCPFCTTRTLLSGEPHRAAFLRTLRYYEIGTGKRLSFRDLYSLLSYIFAGIAPEGEAGAAYDPCAWAAKLVELSSRTTGRPSLRLSAPYALVAAQYQHALFATWPRIGLRAFRTDLQELQLLENATLMGLYYFLSNPPGRNIPPTLASQVTALSELLDPAVADADSLVDVSQQTTIKYRDIDTRFSQSVAEGLLFVQKYRCLSAAEIDLLKRLASADSALTELDVVKRRPATAMRIRGLVRDFACRLVRRSIGMRSAVLRDSDVLADFQKVIVGDAQLLHEAVKQVEGLLNEKDRFIVTLNTTFGEPLPPLYRRATLITQKLRVRSKDLVGVDRPRAPMRFLGVGTGSQSQSIALTYELFRSVRELKKGMIPASLPRPVVAALDATRARVAGQIVRDEEQLEGAEIRLGSTGETIVRELGKFLVRREEGE